LNFFFPSAVFSHNAPVAAFGNPHPGLKFFLAKNPFSYPSLATLDLDT
jgi:hypothetical protein